MHLSSYTATPQQQLTSYAILLRFHWLRLHWILLFLWISTLFLKQVAGVISQPNFSISLEQSIKSINWPSELFKSSNKDSLTLNVPTWCLKKMSLDLKKKTRWEASIPHEFGTSLQFSLCFGGSQRWHWIFQTWAMDQAWISERSSNLLGRIQERMQDTFFSI